MGKWLRAIEMVALWASVLSFVKQKQHFFFFWGEWSFYWKAIWNEETSCKHVDDGGYIFERTCGSYLIN